MNKITCDLCGDLMPLVKDGIASDDSRIAVLQHIEHCEACKALYSGEIPPVLDTNDGLRKLKQKIKLFSIMLMMFGILFGISLTAGSDMFYNCLIMPIIGALGYVIFRWKSLYEVPCLLLVTALVTNVLEILRGTQQMDIYSVFMWSIIYSIFVILGATATGLLHFAFRKEHDDV